MRRAMFAGTWLWLGGCASGAATPTWAFDPVWLEPTDDGDVYGFQTWEVFSERWTRRYDDKFYVCSVVVELEGTPVQPDDDCRGCTHAWVIDAAVLESDCADGLTADPGLLALSRIGIGNVPPELVDDDPYPNQTHGGWADYGTGEWVSHGWAYPDALDTRGEIESEDWDEDQPFTFWPAWVWELDLG